MTVPASIRTAVEDHLTEVEGRNTRVVSATAVGGGCISPGTHIVTDAGHHHFVKWADGGSAPPDFFAEEARSLRTLAAASAIRVPAVLTNGPDWLLMEWLEPGRPRAATWETLGRELGHLHTNTADQFGWPADNYIGSLPQANPRSDDWPSFWMTRLDRQWELAARHGFFDASARLAFDALSANADSLLRTGNHDGPSLLHGDLWSGNVHVMADGTAALIDPSSSYGHREVDLAMARLFGGFDTAFFDAYDEVRPIEPGFDETRCPLYQLYYVLVHVNLFGASYVAHATSILRRFG
jgi:fructosamine-3-kinase